MISKGELSTLDLQNTLGGLIKLVSACESISSREKHCIVKSIVFRMKNFDVISARILVKKIQEKIEVEIVGKTNPAMYPGRITFDDLMNSGKLFEINNSQKPGSAYLYFDESFIVDFDKLNEVSQDKFIGLVRGGGTKYAAAKNEQGVKYLGHDNNLPKCRLNLEDGHNDTTISYELKINGSEDRIGVVSVKSLNDGPELLVATHSIKGGLHNKKHNGKELATKKLSIANQFSQDRRTMFDKVVFFPRANTRRRERDESVETILNDIPMKAI